MLFLIKCDIIYTGGVRHSFYQMKLQKGTGVIVFNKGDLLQYGNNGVCKVEDIVTGMPGFDKTTKYYMLVPISNVHNVIYLPTDNDKAKIRPVNTAKELHKLLSKIDDVDDFMIVNEKQCEAVYKEAIFSLDCTRWLELLKTLCVRKQTRALQGKKVTSTDEKYFKFVSARLTEELTVAFGEDDAKKEMDHAIEAFEGCALV